jgi:hypothetical protein
MELIRKRKPHFAFVYKNSKSSRNFQNSRNNINGTYKSVANEKYKCVADSSMCASTSYKSWRATENLHDMSKVFKARRASSESACNINSWYAPQTRVLRLRPISNIDSLLLLLFLFFNLFSLSTLPCALL